MFQGEIGASENRCRVSIKVGDEKAGHSEKMEATRLTGAVRARTVLGQWQEKNKMCM